MTNKTIPVILDIDEIPNNLYELLLKEFRFQHGENGTFTNWKITANKEPETL